MDIRFCDICNESIAQVHFDEGRAVLAKGRVCVASSGDAATADASRPSSRPAASRGSGSEWMAALAIVVAAGLGWVAVDRAEQSEAALARTLAQERSQMAAALAAFAGERDDDAARTEVERRELLGQFDSLRTEAASGRMRVEELAAGWQGQLASLGAELDALGERSTNPDAERLARIESSLASMRQDVELLGGAMLEALDVLDQPGPSAAAGSAAPSVASTPSWAAIAAGLESADEMVRWDAVDQLARTGDPDAAMAVVPALADGNLVVRMSAARALAELGNPAAVPALIDALEDVEPPVREAAVDALRQLTGRSFRFDPVASESDRARKVESWRRWWERSGTEGIESP